MSKQQINLYQDILREKAAPFSSPILLKVTLLSVSLFILVSLFYSWMLSYRQQTLTLLRQTEAHSLQQLRSLQTHLANRRQDVEIEKQVLKRSEELATKQQIASILSRDEFGNTAGFAAHITGLARQRAEGLWLTELSIYQGGTLLDLHGTMLQAELLPQYLQRLAAEKVFSGKEFRTLQVARRKDNPARLDFSLQNRREATP